MKRVLLVSMMLLAVSMAQALVVTVTPGGDGVSGKDKWWGSGWESSGFIENANPNSSYHWYDGEDGEWRDVYMQVALSSLPDAKSITGATLYLHLTTVSGDGCSIYHAADSSSANGSASQQIGAGEWVADITSGSGWVGFDVTDFIQNDVANGYSFAAFKFVHDGYSNVTFGSGETAGFEPYLSVVPEPATMGLLALGGLLIRRKK